MLTTNLVETLKYPELNMHTKATTGTGINMRIEYIPE